MSGTEFILNVWGQRGGPGSLTVRIGKGKGSSCGKGAGSHVIQHLPELEPHPWPLEAWLSSAAPPPGTGLTSY